MIASVIGSHVPLMLEQERNNYGLPEAEVGVHLGINQYSAMIMRFRHLLL